MVKFFLLENNCNNLHSLKLNRYLCYIITQILVIKFYKKKKEEKYEIHCNIKKIKYLIFFFFA